MSGGAGGLSRAYVGIAVVVGLAAFVGLRSIAGLQPYVAWLAGWSIATFIAYGLDKAQAARGGWRVPEAQLHALAVVGGAAGGWLGMFVFRHKVRKPAFVLVLAGAMAVQLALGFVLLAD